MNPPAIEVVSRSVAETLELGRRLGAGLRGGEVIGLIGPLGAGKTHLVKGIAAGAGMANTEQVTSPTFVLVNEYAARVYLHHVDAYRLRNASDLLALGFEEMYSANAAAIVEWADRVTGALPTDALIIYLHPVGLTERRLTFQPGGPGALALLNATAVRNG